MPKAWWPSAIALAACNEQGFQRLLEPTPWDGLELRTDTFVQAAPNVMDILIVLDTSGSMTDELKTIDALAPVFLDYVVGTGADFHLGVASMATVPVEFQRQTDPDMYGQLWRNELGQRWASSAQDDPGATFAGILADQTWGSDSFSGFGATYGALERHRDGVNEGFVRDEAVLHTILISDEGEFTIPAMLPPEGFVPWYDALKPDPEDRTFSCVIREPVYDGGPVSGDAWAQAARALGGTVTRAAMWDDVLWQQFMEELGQGLTSLTRDFPLSETAASLKFEVRLTTVDGVEQELFEAAFADDGALVSGDWSYSPYTNVLTIHSLVPPALSTVTVTYAVW